MRKILSGLIVIIMCFFFSFPTTESPFDSLLGVKWGVNKIQFKKDLKYPTFRDMGFLFNFSLGDINIKFVDFKFKSKDGKNESDLFNCDDSELFFDSAVMKFEGIYLDNLIKVFIKKYGTPKKNYKILTWKGNKRVITLYEMPYEEDSAVVFESEKDIKNRKFDIQKSVDIL